MNENKKIAAKVKSMKCQRNRVGYVWNLDFEMENSRNSKHQSEL